MQSLTFKGVGEGGPEVRIVLGDDGKIQAGAARVSKRAYLVAATAWGLAAVVVVVA
jgi:hypothetical protein